VRVAVSKLKSKCLEAELSTRTYYFRSKTDDEMYEWLAILQKIVYFFRPAAHRA